MDMNLIKMAGGNRSETGLYSSYDAYHMTIIDIHVPIETYYIISCDYNRDIM